MARINKIVVNQVQARLTSDAREPNTYAYDENGILVRHDDDRVAKRVVGPGVLYGANKDSGDQTGLNTIKLIPNEDINTDQHLVVDPTGPNHIHLRAGGTIDASTTDLVLGGEDTHVYISDSNDQVTLKGSGGQFLTDPTDPNNQIATIGDVTTAQGAGANGEVTRWSPNFQATGLTFTGSGATYPTYNSHYVKNGRMVSFFIEIDLATVTNFGTGQYLTELPFEPLTGTMNHFQAWCLVDETANPDNTGHAILQADHLANTSVLDLHYLKQSGGANSPIMEAQFKQGSPVTLTTATHVYINGTYITAE